MILSTPQNVKKVYVEKNMLTLDWSPDLNLIENLWSILYEKIKRRACNDKACLFNCVQEAWNNLEPFLLTRLVDSMPQRIVAVLAAKGDVTKY